MKAQAVPDSFIPGPLVGWVSAMRRVLGARRVPGAYLIVALWVEAVVVFAVLVRTVDVATVLAA